MPSCRRHFNAETQQVSKLQGERVKGLVGLSHKFYVRFCLNIAKVNRDTNDVTFISCVVMNYVSL